MNTTALIKKLGVTVAISAMTILGAAVYSSANAQTPAPNPAHKGTHKGPHKGTHKGTHKHGKSGSNPTPTNSPSSMGH
jgi:hypothetical protein